MPDPPMPQKKYRFTSTIRPRYGFSCASAMRPSQIATSLTLLALTNDYPVIASAAKQSRCATTQIATSLTLLAMTNDYPVIARRREAI